MRQSHHEGQELLSVSNNLFYSLHYSLANISLRIAWVSLMAVGLLGSGILALLIPTLPSLLWLAVLWALEAVGLAMAEPAEAAFVADLTGSERRGAGYGLYTFAASLGAVGGPVLGGWLYDTQSHALPFYVFGGLLLVGAVAVVILLRGSKRPAGF